MRRYDGQHRLGRRDSDKSDSGAQRCPRRENSRTALPHRTSDHQRMAVVTLVSRSLARKPERDEFGRFAPAKPSLPRLLNQMSVASRSAGQ